MRDWFGLFGLFGFGFGLGLGVGVGRRLGRGHRYRLARAAVVGVDREDELIVPGRGDIQVTYPATVLGVDGVTYPATVDGVEPTPTPTPNLKLS